MVKTTPRISKSAHRAVQIMEALADMPEGAGVTDLHELLGFPVSSLHSILMTLTWAGWLQKDVATSKYRLTSRLFALGSTSLLSGLSFQAFHEVARQMVSQCRETVHLGVLQAKNMLIIAREEGRHPVRLVRNIGEQLPAHSSSIGKVLLSGLTHEELDELYQKEPLSRVTPCTIGSLEQLKRELDQVRNQGYACNLEESAMRLYGVAAPLHDHSGRVVAGLNISALLDRTPPDVQRKLIKIVKEGAAQLEIKSSFLIQS
jgi:IclR family acetate operon transcriptional repressor